MFCCFKCPLQLQVLVAGARLCSAMQALSSPREDVVAAGKWLPAAHQDMTAEYWEVLLGECGQKIIVTCLKA